MSHSRIAALLVVAFMSVTNVLGQARSLAKPAGCGTSMGCYSDCQNNLCSFIITWKQSGNIAEYSLTATTGGAGTWIALGFSSDMIMGNDDVIGCAADSTGKFTSFTTITPNRSKPDFSVDTNVTLTAQAYNNGILYCTLQRPFVRSVPGSVDVTNPWTLLFARSTAKFDSSGGLPTFDFHNQDTHKSVQQLRLSDTKDSLTTDTPPSVQPSVGTVAKPTGCGTTMGCLSDCQNSICTFVVTWNGNGTSAIYTLTANTVASGAWIALGFSTDNYMGNDDVIGCVASPNGSVVSFSTITPFRSRPSFALQHEVNLLSQSYVNGTLSCTLQRPIVRSTNGSVNVSDEWRLLFARSTYNASGGMRAFSFHYNDTHVSWLNLSLSDIIDTTANGTKPPFPTQPPPVTGAITKPTDCGTKSGCFYNSQLDYLISWTADQTSGFYTLIAIMPSATNSYIALGLSTDDKMGNDDIMGCALGANGTVVKFTGTNVPYNSPNFRTDQEVILTNSSFKDNVLTCLLQRPIASSTNGRVNLNNTWIMLAARGRTGDGQPLSIQSHGNDKFIAPFGVDVHNYTDFGGTPSADADNVLIKAHGSLMIVAWIFLASIGIVLARYYKPVWKTLLCSEKVWFQIHRIIMILVFFTTAAGFIIIFIEVDGYSDISEDREFLVGHPIIGIIVMILTVMNPIMALFRCHPGTPKRPIFNWAHWFVGTSAHILGVVNIFFGVLLSRADVPYYLVYILGAYVAWQIFIELLLEVISCFGKKIDRSEAYDLSDGDTPKKVVLEEAKGTIIVKRIILVVHCLIVAAFAAVLIGLLATGKEGLGEES